MRTLILRPAVSDDLAEQADWYDEQAQGLGAELEQEFWDALPHIQREPESFPKAYGEFRRCYIRRFHLHVYFRVTDDRVVIVLVRDARRDDLPIHALLNER